MFVSTESKILFVLGCVFLATAGAFAAFGFHGPVDVLPLSKRASWAWAVEMQYYHGAGLLFVGLLMHLLGVSWLLRIAAGLMVVGMLMFSGLIYAGSLGAPEALGEAVPSGGFMLMVSWLVLAAAIVIRRN
jgi:uncharacterized membrane protein YgdD (TMEM256/DUF423 family)